MINLSTGRDFLTVWMTSESTWRERATCRQSCAAVLYRTRLSHSLHDNQCNTTTPSNALGSVVRDRPAGQTRRKQTAVWEGEVGEGG